eukprot:scaffold78766_cov26-Tisochrysis_lutea.AAC.1
MASPCRRGGRCRELSLEPGTLSLALFAPPLRRDRRLNPRGARGGLLGDGLRDWCARRRLHPRHPVARHDTDRAAEPGGSGRQSHGGP